jgi:prepilin-type N-terminal cleavage/methylation domain-containing protein
MQRYRRGFTLLEILLVIALLGILASIVLTAINPARQLAEARNAQRLDDITEINQALEDYFVTNRAYPTGITGAYQDICPPSGGSGCIDLSVLVPDYLAIIPISPNAATGTTGYTVAINPSNGQISLSAPDSELGVTTAINDLTPLITFAKQAGGTGFDVGSDIATLSDGSSIMTGDFQGTAVFGQSESNQTSLVSTGGSEIFIAKYNSDGELE